MNSGHKSYVFLKAGKFHIKSYYKYELFQGNPNLFLSVQHENNSTWKSLFGQKYLPVNFVIIRTINLFNELKKRNFFA